MTLPSKAEVLDFERRWARPAGIVTLVAVALFAAAIVVLQVGSSADDAAEQLTEFDQHSGRLLVGGILRALSFALLSIPLFVLFKAAAARSERVRRVFIAFAFIGPILFGAHLVVQSAGLGEAASQFVDCEPALQQPGGAEAGYSPECLDSVKEAEDQAADARQDEDADEEDGEPRVQLADEFTENDGSLAFASVLILPGLLGFVFALVYIPLWSMRTGLISRFLGTLGMALGVSMVLLPFAQLAIFLWFIPIGLLLAGLWMGGRPPAWEAGEAIPWKSAGGGPPAGGSGDTVEGSGRELSEPALPDAEAEVVTDLDPPTNGASGPPRRKRKRKRPPGRP